LFSGVAAMFSGNINCDLTMAGLSASLHAYIFD